jgi:hypothetical protein
MGGEFNVSPASADVVSWDGTTLRAVGGNFDASVVEALRVPEPAAGRRLVHQRRRRHGPQARDLQRRELERVRRRFPNGSINDLGMFRGQLVMAGNVGGANVQTWNGSAWSPLASSMNGSAATILPDEFAGHLWIGGGRRQRRDGGGRRSCRFELRAPWANLGNALAGASGPPTLVGQGTLTASADLTFRVASTPANTPGLHVFGSSRLDQPLLGGMLVPAPFVALPFTSDALGVATLGLNVPAALAPGTELVMQSWLGDGSGPHGVTATNAISRRAP